eukprot:INCI1169.1.p1 GENE.INCI1169.1~~INCI1169.1.p1  ORF type:complete len:102 (-),score=7.69 INCI1169.1:447-752(-)
MAFFSFVPLPTEGPKEMLARLLALLLLLPFKKSKIPFFDEELPAPLSSDSPIIDFARDPLLAMAPRRGPSRKGFSDSKGHLGQNKYSCREETGRQAPVPIA